MSSSGLPRTTMAASVTGAARSRYGSSRSISAYTRRSFGRPPGRAPAWQELIADVTLRALGNDTGEFGAQLGRVLEAAEIGPRAVKAPGYAAHAGAKLRA